MWTLPRNVQITIRRIEKPLRDFVWNAAATHVRAPSAELQRSAEIRCDRTGAVRIRWPWNGERLGVIIGQKVCVEKDWRSRHSCDSIYNLISGDWHEAERTTFRREGGWSVRSLEAYFMGTLAPGEVFVVRRDVPTIFVHQLWDEPGILALLEVARDAILSEPTNAIPRDAYRIAKEALPLAHGLFIALVRKERAIVNGEAV